MIRLTPNILLICVIIEKFPFYNISGIQRHNECENVGVDAADREGDCESEKDEKKGKKMIVLD